MGRYLIQIFSIIFNIIEDKALNKYFLLKNLSVFFPDRSKNSIFLNTIYSQFLPIPHQSFHNPLLLGQSSNNHDRNLFEFSQKGYLNV